MSPAADGFVGIFIATWENMANMCKFGESQLMPALWLLYEAQVLHLKDLTIGVRQLSDNGQSCGLELI